MSINKILVLDRNIISVIKNCNSQKSQSRQEQLKMLRYLRFNDRKTISVTSMLSILEGQKGRVESYEEMKDTIESESSALTVFFSKAKVDSSFLLENAESTSKIFIDSNAAYKTKYDLFLEEINPLLIDKPKSSQKLNIKKQIIDIANKHEISMGHPVVMCCISALFGYESSRKIIKFKKNNYNPYNARNDLLVISWFYHLKENAKKIHPNINIKYLTLDKHLNNFLSLVTVTKTTLFSDEIEIDLSYKKDLFPELSHEQYLALNEDCNK